MPDQYGRPNAIEALLAGFGSAMPGSIDIGMRRNQAENDQYRAMFEKRRAEQEALAEKARNDARDALARELMMTNNTPAQNMTAYGLAADSNFDIPKALGVEDQQASTEEMLQRMTGEQKAQTQNFTMPKSSTPRTFGAGFKDVPRRTTPAAAKGMNVKPAGKPLASAGFEPKVKPADRPLAQALQAGIYRRPLGGGAVGFRESPAMLVARATWADILRAKPMVGPVTEDDMKVYAAKLHTALIQRYAANKMTVSPQELANYVSSMTGLDVTQ